VYQKGREASKLRSSPAARATTISARRSLMAGCRGSNDRTLALASPQSRDRAGPSEIISRNLRSGTTSMRSAELDLGYRNRDLHTHIDSRYRRTMNVMKCVSSRPLSQRFTKEKIQKLIGDRG
jgi:hypothetical protein